MRLPQSMCSTIGLLSLNLRSLWMLQLLRLVHIHEEVLQQLLGLHQIVCVYLLVDDGYILSFTVGVLHRSHVQQFLRVRPVCF